MITTILNSRMMSKITVFNASVTFQDLSSFLTARAIYSWVTQVTANVDWTNLVIANGTKEYTARWLNAGDVCRWSLILEDGNDVQFHKAFLAEDMDSEGQSKEAISEEVTVYAGDTYEAEFTAECVGVLWLCIDNFSSWWNTKTVTLKIQ